MDKIREIDDIDQLQQMLDTTENDEQRRAIRQRLIELKKKRREQTNKNLQDLAERREKRINDKKSEADKDKEAKRDFYDEMGKTGNMNMDKYRGAACKKLKTALAQQVVNASMPSCHFASRWRIRLRILKLSNSPQIDTQKEAVLCEQQEQILQKCFLHQRVTEPVLVDKSPRKAMNRGGGQCDARTQPTRMVARSASEIKATLLRWCQQKTNGYPHVHITNYSSSWCDGMAFCALIHHFYPDAFDYSKLDPRNRRENFALAFRLADQLADIPPLIEVDDMIAMGDHPEYRCVFTYVQEFYRKFRHAD